jgi:hypothetical protein
MKIPKSRLKEILERISSLQRDRPCPFCGGTNWSLSPTVFELQEHIDPDEPPIDPRHVYPVVVMQCGGCGHAMLLSAIAFGIDPHAGPT